MPARERKVARKGKLKPADFSNLLAHRIRDLADYGAVRNGSHEFKKLAKKHGTTKSLLKAELNSILRTMSPDHEYFKGKPIENRWLHERTHRMLSGWFSVGAISEKKLKAAAEHNLMRRTGVGFEKDREKRVLKLINSLHSHLNEPEKKGLTRYKLLDRFMERNGYEYKTLKNDLYGIAYAMIPGAAPANRARDSENAAALIRNRKLDSKARDIAEWFTVHVPEIDLERIRGEPPADKELLQIQEEWARLVSELAALHEKHGMHPVAAYALAWQKAGYKEHKELPESQKLVYGLHELARSLEGMENTAAPDESIADRFGIDISNPKEALFTIQDVLGITPEMGEEELRKRLEKVNKAVWQANAKFVKSKIHYTQADWLKERMDAGEKGLELEHLEHLRKARSAWAGYSDARGSDVIAAVAAE
jgi:hypothetical protein